MYSYHLKSEFQKEGLNPNIIYRIAKDGTECAYIWDDHPVYEAGKLVSIDKRKIGWIPARDDFDWTQSKFVKLDVAKNKLVHVWSHQDNVDIDTLNDLLVSDKPCNEIQLPGLKSYVTLNEDINKLKYLESQKYLADLKKFNEKQPGLLATGNTYWTNPPTIQPPKKETMLENIIATNKAAATQAAYLEAGRLANVTMAEILFKKFPMLPQTPFNALIIANLADVIGKQIKPSPKLAKITTAMVTQAYAEVYQLIDLEGMVNELLNTVPGFDDGQE